MTRARDLAAGTFEQATGGVLKLETSDTTVTDGSVLGKIEFKAPDEASGTDAILVGAAIEAVAEGTFAADNNATELVFKTGASAAADAKMILDSSGNLLVGKSAVAVSSVGAELRDGASDYAVTGVSSAQAAALFGRNSNDGDIIRLRKDNAAVGSIGVRDGTSLYIESTASNRTGLDLTGGVLPRYGGSLSNGQTDLGAASYRFKDLYLSGGVYLGGTGSANKLTDYESGTFQTNISTETSGTITIQSNNDTLAYTKVGRLVTITGMVSVTSTGSAVGTFIQLNNLPFTSADLSETSGRMGGHVTYSDASAGTKTSIGTLMLESSTQIRLYVTAANIAGSDDFYVSFSYTTS